jgi:hypothetical protein
MRHPPVTPSCRGISSRKNINDENTVASVMISKRVTLHLNLASFCISLQIATEFQGYSFLFRRNFSQ